MAIFNFKEGDKVVICKAFSPSPDPFRAKIGLRFSLNGITGTIINLERDHYSNRIRYVRVKLDQVPGNSGLISHFQDLIHSFSLQEAIKSLRPISQCNMCVHRMAHVSAPTSCAGKCFTPLIDKWVAKWQDKLSKES